jgi:hypothetical protein
MLRSKECHKYEEQHQQDKVHECGPRMLIMMLLLTTTILIMSIWDHISAAMLTARTMIFNIGDEDEDNESMQEKMKEHSLFFVMEGHQYLL